MKPRVFGVFFGGLSDFEKDIKRKRVCLDVSKMKD